MTACPRSPAVRPYSVRRGLMTAEQRSRRASIAARTRSAPHDPDLANARRELRTERLVDHVRAVLELDPPMTLEQRRTVADVLLTESPSGPDATWRTS